MHHQTCTQHPGVLRKSPCAPMAAARGPLDQVGDMISFVSATFGEEVWSAKGVGLSRVQSAIKVGFRATVLVD